MKPKMSCKLVKVYSLVIICSIAVFLTNHVIKTQYIPYRNVQSVLLMLSSRNDREISRAALNIRGLDYLNILEGDELIETDPPPFNSKREMILVERKILEVLPLISDHDTLDILLSVVDSPQVTGGGVGGLNFGKYGENEWSIIRSAAERYNLRKPDPKLRRYEVSIHDGIHVLQLQLR